MKVINILSCCIALCVSFFSIPSSQAGLVTDPVNLLQTSVKEEVKWNNDMYFFELPNGNYVYISYEQKTPGAKPSAKDVFVGVRSDKLSKKDNIKWDWVGQDYQVELGNSKSMYASDQILSIYFNTTIESIIKKRNFVFENGQWTFGGVDLKSRVGITQITDKEKIRSLVGIKENTGETALPPTASVDSNVKAVSQDPIAVSEPDLKKKIETEVAR